MHKTLPYIIIILVLVVGATYYFSNDKKSDMPVIDKIKDMMCANHFYGTWTLSSYSNSSGEIGMYSAAEANQTYGPLYFKSNGDYLTNLESKVVESMFLQIEKLEKDFPKVVSVSKIICN